MRAIQMHDTGWASSDAQQIQRLRSGGPQGQGSSGFFRGHPAREKRRKRGPPRSIPSKACPEMGAIIVSRHFSLLAQHDLAHHQRFLQAEKLRQRKLESAHAKAEDLERWTAALGFCDLVSLYLLSGLSREVEFPLAHPASPQAETAPRVKMQMRWTESFALPRRPFIPAALYRSRRSSIRCRRRARVPRHSLGGGE